MALAISNLVALHKTFALPRYIDNPILVKLIRWGYICQSLIPREIDMSGKNTKDALNSARGLVFPRFQPDETLYSWVVRFHRLNCETDPHRTSRLLFEHPRAGLKRDIPFNLSRFAANTNRTIEETTLLLKTRSVFGFHAQFLSIPHEKVILECLLGDRNSKARGLLGLTRSGLEVVSPLRWCPECVDEQTRCLGAAWWQLTHQIPSAFICESHVIPLRTSAEPFGRIAINNLYLPEKSARQERQTELFPDSFKTLFGITHWGSTILGDSEQHMTDGDLRWCYLMQAKSRGWVAFDGSVRLHALRDAFLEKYKCILGYFGKDFFGDLEGVNGGFIGYSLRQATGRRHPLKHILLQNFLFDNYAEFQRAFGETQTILKEEGTRACEQKLRDNQRQLMCLVFNEVSVQKAAMALDTSTTSAIRFLDKNCINRERRPHIIGTDKEKRLCLLLAQGRPRKEIAEAVGVRRTFIKNYLSLHPEQRNQWDSEKRQKDTRTHRQHFLKALRDHPELPIKTIRRLPQNGFQWLYNNDLEWLRSILPGLFHR